MTTPAGRERDGKPSDTIELVLYVDSHKFHRAAQKETVIAIWGEEGGPRRLVFGELDGATYRPLWDSVLFNSAMLRLGYDDLDGDGVDEIVLEARLGDRGLGWVMFNTKGEEISRQDCGSNPNSDVPPRAPGPGIACAITGGDNPQMEYDRRPDGKIDLLVYDWRPEPRRFSLVNGRYVLQTPKPKRSKRK